jgi:xylulokinase
VVTHQPVVIGLDASTTACKAIAYEAGGAAVAEGRQGLALLHPQPDWYEQPADAWWEAAASALRQVSSQIAGSRLAALCISHQRESFVPLDAKMRPLRHAIIWLDERSRELLPALEARLGPETFHRLTGRPLTANLVTGKIAWLRRYEPEVFAHACYYADTHACLVLRLTGQLRTGWGSADPTGLFATMERRWADAVLAVLDLRAEQFPELHPPGAVIGAVTQGAAAQTGLPAGLPVVCGLGDGQAAGLGANITAPGPAYLNLGTAVVTGTYSEEYLTDRAFRTTCGGIPNSFLLETVLLGGAYTLSWFAEMMAPDAGDDEQGRLAAYETAAANLPAGAEGLMLLPYWNSAMNPYWDAAASGVVIGWRGHHDRRHLYRAILEGVAYELRLHIEGVEAATGRPITELIVMGGGSRSALWRQIIADVTGKGVRRCGTPEASALGAAILGAAGVGIHPGVREAAETMTRLDAAPALPDPERRDTYSRLYEAVYRPLYPALRSSLQTLAALA